MKRGWSNALAVTARNTVVQWGLFSLAAAAAAQGMPPPGQAGQPANRPPGGMRPIKAGVCPLPTLPALPALNDVAFFAKTDVPHGRIEQASYRNYAGQDKRMHIYLPSAMPRQCRKIPPRFRIPFPATLLPWRIPLMVQLFPPAGFVLFNQIPNDAEF